MRRRFLDLSMLTAVCMLSAGFVEPLAADAETVVQHGKPTIAPPVDAYTAAEKTTQGNLGHPYVLPPASRARMHECGVEWQAMKLSGEATDKIWRVFAAVCLTTQSDKTPNTSDTAKQR